ncbi:MAG: acyl carrier protein [Butyrivibrio sp.]|nr:acyl carrier protein [Butyrivibrio sp.]
MGDTFTEIVDIIIDIADMAREKVTKNSHFVDDLDLTSLEILAIITKVEKKYSVKFSKNDFEVITTVGDLVSYLSKS